MNNWYKVEANIRSPSHLVTILRYGGECGRVGFDWCANGDDFVAGTLQAGPGRTQVIICQYEFLLKIEPYEVNCDITYRASFVQICSQNSYLGTSRDVLWILC